MKWANKELPTLEEAAELLAETDRRYFLGKGRGCTEPGTITPLVTDFSDSDGWIHPTLTRAYAFRLDWVSPVPYAGGPKSKTLIAIYRNVGVGTDEAGEVFDFYRVERGLTKQEALESIDLILTRRLPKRVEGGENF